MSFNISKKAVSATTFLHLLDPATDEKLYDTDEQGNKVPVGINLFGKASAQYRQALSQLSKKGLLRKNKPQSFEVNVEDSTEILVAISQSSNLNIDGVPVNDAKSFLTLYNEPTLFWVKEQVQATLEDTAAFIQK